LATFVVSFDDELKRVPIGKPAPAATFNLDGAKVRPACTLLRKPKAHILMTVTRFVRLFSRQALAANLKSAVEP